MRAVACASDRTRRTLPRAAFGGEVEVFTWEGQTRIRLTDLSSSGAFLRCRNPLTIGRYLTLRLRLPGGRAFTLLGRVVRQVQSRTHGARASGMGLRFIDISHRDRRSISAYVASRA